jgi:hypothetical protein
MAFICCRNIILHRLLKFTVLVFVSRSGAASATAPSAAATASACTAKSTASAKPTTTTATAKSTATSAGAALRAGTIEGIDYPNDLALVLIIASAGVAEGEST